MKFELFKRYTLRGKRWFFRVKARNGEIVAQSQGVKNYGDCLTTVQAIAKGAANATIAVVK